MSVIDIDPATSSIIGGEAVALLTEELTIEHCSWHPSTSLRTGEASDEPFEVNVKIRYGHPGARGPVYPEGERRS